MIVIPAIDLRGGRAVRLFRGDPGAETEYSDDPVEVAERFEREGARRLHVVDLDAALDTGENREIVDAICRRVAIPVQLGGGLRSVEAVEDILESGVARAVLGTAAATDPGFVEQMVARFDDRIVVAVDVKDDRVMVRGWQEAGAPDATQRAHQLYKRILAEFEPPPLDPAIAEELDAFVAKRKEEGGVPSD